MAFKARVLIPAGALIAAVVAAAACAPPPACPATPHSAAGPQSQDPISSWGVDATAVTTVVIGDVVYVGGTFKSAVSPSGQSKPRANLAAFCLANGSLLDSFVANLSGKAQMSTSATTEAWALTTDGSSLFVGGNFDAVNGTTTGPLAKLDPVTGAVRPFATGTIPDIVYALDFFGGNVYAGGDFSIGSIRKGARFDNTTGALDPAWNANADAKIQSLKVSLDGRWVYIGGSFQNVQSQAHDKLAKLALGTAAVQQVLYGNRGPGVVGATVLDIAVDSTNQDQIFAALGPKPPNQIPPPPAGSGNRFVQFNSTGGALWDDSEPDGDGQAVELIGSILYSGFHDGWNGDHTKRLEGLTASTGNTTSFMPAANGIKGVFDLAQSSGGERLIAVGDFNDVGNTHNLHGLAIFP